MKDRQFLTSLVVALIFGCSTNASAQNPARVEFSGGAGWLMPSPEAVLIDSRFFPDVRNGPSQILDTRTDFVSYAPDWFGDVVVFITPRIGIMGQVSEARAHHPIFVVSKGIINYTRSHAYLGGVRVNLHCCKGVPFIYGLIGRVHSRSHVDIGDPSINPPFEGPSGTSLGAAFGGGVETPGVVAVRVTADLMTASRHVKDSSDWTVRLNAGLVIAIRRR
jgi:hypothetical protein